MIARVPPPTRNSGLTPLEAARSFQQAYIQEHFQSAFDIVAATLTRIAYAVTSAVSGEALPHELMQTFFASDRRQAFDGVFVLDEARTNVLIRQSDAISASLAGQKLLITRAFQMALDGAPPGGAKNPMIDWAASIVERLRSRRVVRGAQVSEDITSADYSEIVEGHRTRGAFVQLGVDEFPVFIAFGGLRLHLEGSATLLSSSGLPHDYLRLRLSAVVTDTFDFHEGPGTSWLDHVFFRLQHKGDAKPFTVEGHGTPFTLSIHATPNNP